MSGWPFHEAECKGVSPSLFCKKISIKFTLINNSHKNEIKFASCIISQLNLTSQMKEHTWTDIWILGWASNIFTHSVLNYKFKVHYIHQKTTTWVPISHEVKTISCHTMLYKIKTILFISATCRQRSWKRIIEYSVYFTLNHALNLTGNVCYFRDKRS